MRRLLRSAARDALAAGEPEPPQAANSSPSDGLSALPRRPEQSAPGDAGAGLDVAGRIALLKRSFEQRSPDVRKAAHSRLALLLELARQAWVDYRRLLKALLGLLVIVAAGWIPVRALLETTSTEAVINARLITLRAPIEGEIAAISGALSVGVELQPGAPMLRVVNRRADRGRLDDLRRVMDRLEGERDALLGKRKSLEALHSDLIAQTEAFREGRTRQLEARAAELKSEIAAAWANRQEAERVVARVKSLAESGTMTTAAFDKARRDAAVAAETHAALGHRLAGIEVELAALRQGVFVGDSYNDRPRSSQRADEIAQRLAEIAADLGEREAHLAGLRTELDKEAARYAELATADLSAPVRASVWEILTAPGESVVRGQELARLLDCSGVVVTATVGETAYNHLRVGDPARFRFRGESTDHRGRIVGLTGVAVAPANLAIQPAALAKEPYRVTVALPGLAVPGQCDVGRTGRVTFGK